MPHLLVTNDYPPKVGGIQNYLWELWRRLPTDEVCVLTRPHPGDRQFDAREPYPIVRTRQPFLLPEPWLLHQIEALARQRGADIVLFDPVFPVGALGPWLSVPYGLILHGAEVTVPGRLPLTRPAVAASLRQAAVVITGGAYSTAEAERAAGRPLPVAVVAPGVDTTRFAPLPTVARAEARAAYGLAPDQPVVLGLSRLVPRKGFDRLIEAAGRVVRDHADLVVLIAGQGRDRARLERLATTVGAPVRFLGVVPDADMPALYGLSDLFAMVCRNRWRGLEQEGFGIVFLEAAAAGVAQLAGRSGGAAEAVEHGETGLVVDEPDDAGAVASALGALLGDPERRRAMGLASRRRAVEQFDYDIVAQRLLAVIETAAGRTGSGTP